MNKIGFHGLSRLLKLKKKATIEVILKPKDQKEPLISIMELIKENGHWKINE